MGSLPSHGHRMTCGDAIDCEDRSIAAAHTNGADTILAKQQKSLDQWSRLKRAPGGIRTPNLLIRSQMLYPLSYGRMGLA